MQEKLLCLWARKSSLWTLEWIAEILVLLHTTLLMSHQCFNRRILPLWWYLVLQQVMELSWIYFALQLVWRSVQRNIWTSWKPFCYCGCCRTLGLTMWCWSTASLGEKVRYFVRADIWPSNSPDLNLLDYILWGVLQARTNALPHSSAKSLKTYIVRVTSEIKRAEVSFSWVGTVIAQEDSHIKWWMFVCLYISDTNNIHVLP